MGVLQKGTTYSDGTQVTSTNLNNHVDNATFTSSAIDGTTTQLSGGAIIVKDGGVAPAKLSSGHPNWVSTGETIVGHTAAIAGASGVTPLLQAHATNQDAGLSATRFSADTGGANLVLGKSRGAAIGSNAIVSEGDTLGTIIFSSDDGTDLDSSALIRAICNDAPSSNNRPSDLIFATTDFGDSSPSEQMRITSEGRVGIGTSSPQVEMVVSDTTGDCSFAVIANSSNSSYIDFGDENNSNVGKIRYAHSDDSMRFFCDSIERFRVVNDAIRIGQITTDAPGIGNTTLGAAFNDTGEVLNISGEGLNINRNSDGNAIDFYKSGNSVGGVHVTASGVSYNTTSDYRLKENIKPLNNSIYRIIRLKPSSFNFKTDPEKSVYGFIAHEVQEVMPDAVTGVKDGEEMQQLDQSKLVPLLTSALQETLVKIDSLEKRINKLENAG